MDKFNIFLLRISFGRDVRQNLYTLLADLCQSGIALNEAMEICMDVYRVENKSVVTILEDLRTQLKINQFQACLQKYVPQNEASLFSQFGKTDSVLLFRSAARIVEVDKAIKTAVNGALIMPVFIIIVLFVLFYFLGSDFFPALILVSEIEDWPTSWQITAAIAIWIAENPFKIVVTVAVIYAAYKATLLFYVGSARRFLDRYPPFVFYKITTGAIFTFVLTENARIGTAITTEFLNSLARSGSLYFRTRVNQISRHLVSATIGEATIYAGNDFPDRELNLVLKALNNREGWEQPFSEYCDRWIERIQTKVKNYARALNTILMFFAAIAVGMVGRIIFGIVNVIQ